MHSTDLFRGASSKPILVFQQALVWGFAGGFFGVVFVAFYKHLNFENMAWWNTLAAAAVAGAVVGSFYSAKRVAIVGAAAGTVTSLLILVLSIVPQTVEWVALLSASTGLLAGGAISIFFERRRGALVLAVDGVLSGLVAGAAATGAALLVPGLGKLFFQCFIMVPVTGLLFVHNAFKVGGLLRDSVPHWLSTAAVSAIIATVIGIGMWSMSASLRLEIDPALKVAIREMFGNMPQAFLGGLTAGALAGMALELLGIKLLKRF